MSGRWTWSLVCSVGITGCGLGGQSGTETKRPFCTAASSTPIGADDPSAQGTPNALAAAVAGERRTSIRHGLPPAGPYTDTELVLEVFLNVASARVVTSTRWDGQPSSSCGDHLEVDGELRFETADGAFAERFAGTVVKSQLDLRFRGTLPASELRGSYDAGTLLSGYVGPYYLLSTTVSPPLSGNLCMNGDDPDSDPGTTVTVSPIASWPAPGAAVPDGGQ
jgi:hypothetical protein